MTRRLEVYNRAARLQRLLIRRRRKRIELYVEVIKIVISVATCVLIYILIYLIEK